MVLSLEVLLSAPPVAVPCGRECPKSSLTCCSSSAALSVACMFVLRLQLLLPCLDLIFTPWLASSGVYFVSWFTTATPPIVYWLPTSVSFEVCLLFQNGLLFQERLFYTTAPPILFQNRLLFQNRRSFQQRLFYTTAPPIMFATASFYMQTCYLVCSRYVSFQKSLFFHGFYLFYFFIFYILNSLFYFQTVCVSYHLFLLISQTVCVIYHLFLSISQTVCFIC